MALLGGVGRRPRRAAFAHGEVHACYYHDLQGRIFFAKSFEEGGGGGGPHWPPLSPVISGHGYLHALRPRVDPRLETRYRAAAPLLLAIQGHTREDKAKGSLEKERRMDIRALKMLAIGDITVRA
jgi:hypothetical protein